MVSVRNGQALKTQGTVGGTVNQLQSTYNPVANTVLQNQGGGGGGGTALPPNQTQYSAATALSGHRAVILNGNGMLEYADSSTLSHAGRIIGITTNGGTSIIVQSCLNLVEPSWTWDVTLPIFLGTNGSLTQTPPFSGFVQYLGFPSNSITMFIEIFPPIYF